LIETALTAAVAPA